MTDEVRQEDREAAVCYLKAHEAYWVERSSIIFRGEHDPLAEAFARHASPLRDRIAVLEGALTSIAEWDDAALGHRSVALDMRSTAFAALTGGDGEYSGYAEETDRP